MTLHDYRNQVRDVLYAGKSGSTTSQVDCLWNQHVAPSNRAGQLRADCRGSRPLGSIASGDIVRWIQSVARSDSINLARSVRGVFPVVGQVFEYAAKHNHIKSSPMPRPKDAGLPQQFGKDAGLTW